MRRHLFYLLSWILLPLLIGRARTIAEPMVTAVAPTPPVTPIYTPLFETADCQFPLPSDETIQCGYLTVPEGRANPQRAIRLHVAIVASHSDTPAPDPVIFLNGGPGSYTLENIGWLLPVTSDILARRDMIFFDQRGVGYSEPSLDCPETAEARLANIERPLDTAAWQAITLEAMLACRQRLAADGVNLSAYHSAASAVDVEDLRQVLGYESWNLLGFSYGTRLALTIMRDFWPACRHLLEELRAAGWPEVGKDSTGRLLSGERNQRQTDAPIPTGRYVLQSMLAAGGMGEVYLGRDTVTGQQVAVKRLRPELAQNPDSLARFVREGEALRRLVLSR